MKIVKIIVSDENGEQELLIKDGTLLMLTEDNQILSQVTTNAAINLELLKKILG